MTFSASEIREEISEVVIIELNYEEHVILPDKNIFNIKI
jgi:hypothetical protein